MRSYGFTVMGDYSYTGIKMLHISVKQTRNNIKTITA